MRKPTLVDVEERIQHVTYSVLPSGRTTVCEITLTNGFTVTGESSVVSMNFYDREIGEATARNKALDKVFGLVAYDFFQEEKNSKMIVSEDDHKELLKLNALECAGVDNWQGYDDAMDIYRDLLTEAGYVGD